jgi:Zn-dependent oligopeptidase
LILTGLVDATEQAWEVLAGYCAQQQQQQQGEEEEDALRVPPDSQLCLLLISTDILQLLLTHHPDPGVRQQLYLSGLLPLLNLQDQVLGIILHLRQQWAVEQEAAGGYAQLVLSGSCLGGVAAGEQLLQQLLPFSREHAEAEWQQLQQLAVRQARADGRRVRPAAAAAAVEPWDVAHISLRVVSKGWLHPHAPGPS